jgi:Mn2+/Fe2+ NRAMP family transporter
MASTRWILRAPSIQHLRKIMSKSEGRSRFSSELLGAAFLMATSAIGPGFITQTTVFTQKLTTSFGFVILCSIVLDIIVQLNIWRVISVSGLRAQELTNRFLPGSGHVLAALIVLGGLAFNTGNLAGAALGIQVMFDLDLWIGVIISTVISLFIFWYKDAGKAMDWFAKILGFVMIALTAYIAFSSSPPIGKAIQHSFLPEEIDSAAIIVLVGGTVGGYISFAGIHRLLDAGIKGNENIQHVSKAAVNAIVIASSMRILLFLASLGIVMAGFTLSSSNPPADVFRIAAGDAGYRIFGLVLWSAAITSVVGSAYTSISFLRGFHPALESKTPVMITSFILFSAIIFLIIGRPVNILIIVGALNAVILPFALALILLISNRKSLMGTYNHPRWLTILGWAAVLAITIMSIKTIFTDFGRLWR